MSSVRLPRISEVDRCGLRLSKSAVSPIRSVCGIVYAFLPCAPPDDDPVVVVCDPVFVQPASNSAAAMTARVLFTVRS